MMKKLDAIVASAVKPEQFNAVYIPMFDEGKKDTGKALSPLYDWREMTTFIRRPAYGKGQWAR